jgi:hypothetical protein
LTAVSLRWCSYCRTNQPAADFVDIYEVSRGRRRKCNSKCGKCKVLKKLSQAARDRRGERKREDLRAEAKRKLEDIIRRRSDPTA